MWVGGGTTAQRSELASPGSGRCGIYSIVNLVTQCLYVGSSINIPKRLASHKSYLRRGKHGNSHLQRSYNKHGIDAFQFRALEFCSPEVLLDREQHYFDILKPQFNQTLDAFRCNWGRVNTHETRQRVSAAIVKHGKVVAPNGISWHSWILEQLTAGRTRPEIVTDIVALRGVTREYARVTVKNSARYIQC